MAISSTTRLGLTQWSSGADPFNRVQLNDSLAAIDALAAGFLLGSSAPPTASSQYEGFFHYNTSTSILSFCDGTEWINLTGEGFFGTPETIAVGDSPQEGTASTFARSDHGHGMADFSANTPQPIGTSGDKGSASTIARSDHRHAIGTGAVNLSSMFAAGVVDADALAASAVTESKVAPSAITATKIGAAAVTASKIGAGAVTTEKVEDYAITTEKLAETSVTNTKLATDSVSTGKIQADAVTTAKIAGGQVTGSKIAASTITDANLANDAVITAKIQNSAVTTTKIAPDGVTTSNIAPNAVTNAKIAGGIDVGKIYGGVNTLDSTRGPLKIKTNFDSIIRESTVYVSNVSPTTEGADYDLWFKYTTS